MCNKCGCASRENIDNYDMFDIEVQYYPAEFSDGLTCRNKDDISNVKQKILELLSEYNFFSARLIYLANTHVLTYEWYHNSYVKFLNQKICINAAFYIKKSVNNKNNALALYLIEFYSDLLPEKWVFEARNFILR